MWKTLEKSKAHQSGLHCVLQFLLTDLGTNPSAAAAHNSWVIPLFKIWLSSLDIPHERQNVVYSLQGKKVLCVAHPGLWKEDAVDGMSFWEFADDDFSCEFPDEGQCPPKKDGI